MLIPALAIILISTLVLYDFDQRYTNRMYTAPIRGAILTIQDAGTGEALPGARFELYTSEGVNLGVIATGQDGRMIAKNLSSGSYYFRETNPPAGYDFSPGENRYPFTIELGNASPIEVTVDNIAKTYPLTIKKTVDNDSGAPLTIMQGALEFLFDIVIGGPDDDETTYMYTINGGEERTFRNGDVIRLKHGDFVTFPEIPYRTPYQITQRATAGYRISTDAPPSGRLPLGGRLVTFTNTFRSGSPETGTGGSSHFTDAEVPTGTLTVEKTAVNDNGAPLTNEQENLASHFTLFIDGKTFEKFNLKTGEQQVFLVPAGSNYLVAEDDNLLAGRTDTPGAPERGVIGTSGETVSFFNVFGEAAYETVRIEGKKNWALGFSGILDPPPVTIHIKRGDTIVSDIAVTAGDAWKWSAELPAYEDDGVTAVAYTIEEDLIPGFDTEIEGYDVTNTYRGTPATLNPPVRKTVTGDRCAPSDFTFEMAAVTSWAPMPPGSENGKKTVVLRGAGEVEFGNITYATEGTYVYTVRELAGIDGNYLYDSAEYTMTVVTRFAPDGATLEKDVAYQKKQNGATVELTDISADNPLLFTNVYTAPTPAAINIDGNENSQSQSQTSPKTGGSTNLLLWTLLLIMGSGILVILIIRKNNAENEFGSSGYTPRETAEDTEKAPVFIIKTLHEIDREFLVNRRISNPVPI